MGLLGSAGPARAGLWSAHLPFPPDLCCWRAHHSEPSIGGSVSWGGSLPWVQSGSKPRPRISHTCSRETLTLRRWDRAVPRTFLTSQFFWTLRRGLIRQPGGLVTLMRNYCEQPEAWGCSVALSGADWAGAQPLSPRFPQGGDSPWGGLRWPRGWGSPSVGAITVFFQVMKNLQVIFQKCQCFLVVIFNIHFYSYFGCKTRKINSKVEPLS